MMPRYLFVLCTLLFFVNALACMGDLPGTGEAPESASPSEDACTLARESIKAVLTDGEQDAFDTKRRTLTERLSLANGGELQRSVGGCHHLNVHYQWTGLSLDNASDDAKWPHIVQGLLEGTPDLSKCIVYSGLFSGLAEAMTAERVRDDAHRFGFPCGEAFCQLEIDQNKTNSSIHLRYDFAL
jgi:hypothetical protein